MRLNIIKNSSFSIFAVKEIFIKKKILFFFNDKKKNLKIKTFISLLLKAFF